METMYNSLISANLTNPANQKIKYIESAIEKIQYNQFRKGSTYYFRHTLFQLFAYSHA